MLCRTFWGRATPHSGQSLTHTRTRVTIWCRGINKAAHSLQEKRAAAFAILVRTHQTHAERHTWKWRRYTWLREASLRGLNQHFKRAGNKNTPGGGEERGAARRQILSAPDGAAEEGKKGWEGEEEEEGGVFRCADWNKRVCVCVNWHIFVLFVWTLLISVKPQNCFLPWCNKRLLNRHF